MPDVLFDLMLAVLSLLGLLVYSTVAVATYRFTRDRLSPCDRWCATWPCKHDAGAGAVAAFWLVTLPAWGFGIAVAFVSGGPVAWGTRLASLLDRRPSLSLSEREARIAEKERELGIDGADDA